LEGEEGLSLSYLSILNPERVKRKRVKIVMKSFIGRKKNPFEAGSNKRVLNG